MHLRTDDSGIAPTCWDQQDETCTDGSIAVANYNNGKHWELTGIRMSLQEATVLSSIRGVGGAPLFNFWDVSSTIAVNVHSSPEAFANDALNGDVVANLPANLLEDPPAVFGGSADNNAFEYHSVAVGFEPILLPAGDYVVSSHVGAGLPTTFWWALSTIAGGCDIHRKDFDAPGTWTEFCDFPPLASAAVDILGYTAGTCTNDSEVLCDPCGDSSECEGGMCVGPEGIPAVSEWGLIIMSTLLLVVGSWGGSRRRQLAA